LRALVTGATGFLGRRVVPRLLLKGASVRVLARPSSNLAPLLDALPPGTRERIEVRILRSHEAPSAPFVAGISHVFHLAATIRSSPAVVYRSNVSLTRRLAESALEAGVERFVLVSSIAVYRTDHLRTGASLDEWCPLEPRPEDRDVYAFSKVMQERAAREAGLDRGLPLVVTRPGVLFGPGQEMAVGRVGLAVGPWLVRVTGGRRLPYCFVDNAADAVVLAGTEQVRAGEAFNLVDDELPSCRDVLWTNRARGRRYRSLPVPYRVMALLAALYEAYYRRTRGMVPLVLSPYRAQAQWKRLLYPNERARTGLGWRPAVPLREALSLTAGRPSSPA
jgi:nucleoside-diphosphate-sugar epimerase